MNETDHALTFALAGLIFEIELRLWVILEVRHGGTIATAEVDRTQPAFRRRTGADTRPIFESFPTSILENRMPVTRGIPSEEVVMRLPMREVLILRELLRGE